MGAAVSTTASMVLLHIRQGFAADASSWAPALMPKIICEFGGATYVCSSVSVNPRLLAWKNSWARLSLVSDAEQSDLKPSHRYLYKSLNIELSEMHVGVFRVYFSVGRKILVRTPPCHPALD